MWGILLGSLPWHLASAPWGDHGLAAAGPGPWAAGRGSGLLAWLVPGPGLAQRLVPHFPPHPLQGESWQAGWERQAVCQLERRGTNSLELQSMQPAKHLKPPIKKKKKKSTGFTLHGQHLLDIDSSGWETAESWEQFGKLSDQKRWAADAQRGRVLSVEQRVVPQALLEPQGDWRTSEALLTFRREILFSYPSRIEKLWKGFV